MKTHVALVGMMGVGKSSIGKALARALGRPFVDSDAAVVAERGMPIAQIFAEEGEDAFRIYELAALRRAVAGEPAVIATGGGAVTHPQTHALLAEHALRVYLTLSPAALKSRLRRSRTRRPILAGGRLSERVSALLAARDALYREAELLVSCDGMSRAQVVRALTDALAEAVR
jgi:shikimate kinase